MKLEHKVTALVVATTLVALLLSGAALLYFDVRDYRETRLNDLRTTADILARAGAPALVFDDRKEAQTTVETLRSVSTVDLAAFYGADGEIFAVYQEPGFMPPARAPGSG